MQPRAQALGEWSSDESTLKGKKENCGTRAGGPCGVCAIAELETTMQKRTAIVNAHPPGSQEGRLHPHTIVSSQLSPRARHW